MPEALRSVAYELFTEFRTRRFVRSMANTLAKSGEVTLVYQMGRVGSQTLNDALLQAGAEPVYHVHWLSHDRLADACERARRHYGYVKPRHLRVSRVLRSFLDDGGMHAVRWRIVTVVRDPIARNLSDHFLSLGNYTLRDFFERYRRGKASLDEVVDDFVHGYDHGCRDSWFDEEIGAVFGIDVLVHSFDHSRRYAIIEKDGVSVLVLRQEDLRDTLSPALAEWLGVIIGELPQRHVSARDPNGDVYRQLLERVRLPQDLVDRMYAIPWVRHFYTPEEIASFRKRWQT